VTCSQISTSRDAIKPWYITNGPDHCKSTSWFDDILVEQVREIAFVGFTAHWKFPMRGIYGVGDLVAGEFRQHALIACSTSDQPATQRFRGNTTHNAMNACVMGPPCEGSTLARDTEPVPCTLESVIPKHGSHLPGQNTVTWHRIVDDPGRLQLCCDNEAAMSTIVDALARVEDTECTRGQRRQRAKQCGWTHTGFLTKLHGLYGFDLIKDVVPDLMHLAMGLIKDLAHCTDDVLNGWSGKPEPNPCGVNTYDGGFFIDHMMYDFRVTMPPSFARGRRYPRDLSHAAISSWSA
jgi:hypothetical protein